MILKGGNIRGEKVTKGEKWKEGRVYQRQRHRIRGPDVL